MKKIPLFLIVLTALAGCSKAPTAVVTASKPVVVRTVPIEFSTEAAPVNVSGVLARRTEADLAFKIGGVVDEVAVRAGDRVTKDQVLARLRLDEIDAQVAAARSGVEKARRDLARTEKLQSGAVATLENLQDARTAVDQAEAQLRIAEFNRRHAVIVAPEAGRILRRMGEPNEIVSPGKAMLGFAADAGGWIVRAGLAERDVARVRLNDPAALVIGGSPSAVAGRLIHLSEGVDAGTRTTPVEIGLETAPTGARSGFVVGVTLTPPEVAARPVVPAAALIEGAGGTASIFVIEEGAKTVKRLIVQIEELRGERAYLRTPLPRTARLVVSGGEYLRDGQTVVEGK
jgi:membrane fusion protein, multidrug efflux system